MTDVQGYDPATSWRPARDQPALRHAYVAVLPVKRTCAAKSRLHVDRRLRNRLALAFALDTTAALLGAQNVDEVVVVTSDPVVRRALAHPRTRIAPEPGPGGLLAAIRHGRRTAAQLRPEAPVVVLPSDLPALTGEAIDAVLREAAVHPGPSFVADALGAGTTLVALHAAADEPRYGTDSAARHAAAGFTRLLTAPASARRDVDTLPDLREALALGAGAWTRAVLRNVAGHTGALRADPRATASDRARRAGALRA